METAKTTTLEFLPHGVSDAAWKSILPFLEACPKVYVGSPETCRRFLSAVVWIATEGATWWVLPEVYGYWHTIYRRFGRWCDAGVFEAPHEHFHDAGEVSAILVNSTIVRAHSCAAGAPKKRGTRCSMPRTKSGRIYHETESFSQRCVGALTVDFDPRQPQRYNASVCVDPRVLL